MKATTRTEMKSTPVSNNSKLRSIVTPMGHPRITQKGICIKSQQERRCSHHKHGYLSGGTDRHSQGEILSSKRGRFQSRSADMDRSWNTNVFHHEASPQKAISEDATTHQVISHCGNDSTHILRCIPHNWQNDDAYERNRTLLDEHTSIASTMYSERIDMKIVITASQKMALHASTRDSSDCSLSAASTSCNQWSM